MSRSFSVPEGPRDLLSLVALHCVLILVWAMLQTLPGVVHRSVVRMLHCYGIKLNPTAVV